MLDSTEKFVLESTLRYVLCEKLKTQLVNNPRLEKFITEGATYSQLLNSVFNQHKEHYNLTDELLESIALYTICERFTSVNEKVMDHTVYNLIKKSLAKVRTTGKKYPGVKVFAKWVSLGIGASIAGAYVYNMILAKYVRGCKSVPKEDLLLCIKKVKIKSLQKVLQSLKIAQGSCRTLDEPDEIEICQREYSYEMEKIQTRISKLLGDK
jgi:hypothetical protein